MRTIRSFLPLIAIALVLAACSGSSAALSTVGNPVAAPAAVPDTAAGGGSEAQPPANGVPQPAARPKRWSGRRRRRRQDHPDRHDVTRGQRPERRSADGP